MKFAYVCTNYNNSAMTGQAVASLLAGGVRPIGIVVVDNLSEESDRDSLRRMAARQSDVDIVFNERNIGYFPGLNVGIGRVRQVCPDVDVIVVGNNDLIFPNNFGAVLEAARDSWTKYAVVSPSIITLDGVHQNPHVIHGISWRRRRLYDLYHCNYTLASLMLSVAKRLPTASRSDTSQWRVSREIHMGFGACYVLGPKFIKEFGRLWAPTFLMGEEWFLSKQLRDAGHSIFYDSSIHVRHCDHASTGKVPSRRMWEYSRIAHRLARRLDEGQLALEKIGMDS